MSIVTADMCSNIYSLLSQMEQTSCTFYLTGSRYFNTHTTTSDWDFFVVDNKTTRSVLENLSFDVETEAAYSGVYVTSVYRHSQFPVHVQLVLPDYIDAKMQIQRIIKDAGLQVVAKFTGHDADVTTFWKFACDLYEHGAFLEKEYTK